MEGTQEAAVCTAPVWDGSGDTSVLPVCASLVAHRVTGTRHLLRVNVGVLMAVGSGDFLLWAGFAVDTGQTPGNVVLSLGRLH